MTSRKRVLRSDGELEAKAFIATPLPEPSPAPPIEPEPVRVADPRQVPTVQLRAIRRASGPRNPEQKEHTPPPPPAVDFPDGLPTTATQRMVFDPELIARLRAEALREQAEEEDK